MDLGEAVTLAGATILITILVEVLKRTLDWGKEQVDRFGPFVALLFGVVVVVLLSAAQGQYGDSDPLAAIASSVITGILAGAASAGLYDTVGYATGQGSVVK
jgi:ABC-type transport system involved in cytochrome c biogenesis permease component